MIRVSPVARRRLATTVVAAVALVATGGALASSATAATRELGGVMWSSTKGNSETLLSITTEKGCAADAKRVSATIYGKGMPAKGQVVVTPSTLLFSATQPMTLPISNAFVIYAQDNATPLVGDYKLKVRCTDRFGVNSLGEFETSMTWKTPGNSLKNIYKATFVAKNTAVVKAADAAPPRDNLPPIPAASAAATPAPSSSAAQPSASAPAASAPVASGPAALPTETIGATAATDTSGGGSRNAPQIVAIFAAFALLAGAGWWIFRRKEGAA